MAQLVREVFGQQDFYSVLGVSKQASNAQLKRAYFKRALLWHPDKNGGSEEATKKFQAIGFIHSVLKDPERRAAYDETGEFEDEVVVNAANEAMWNDYWRALFPKVTTDAISKFSASYRESKEETTDVLRSYVRHKGDLKKVLEETMCCSDSDEPRFIEAIETAIANKEVQRFSAFTRRVKALRRERVGRAGGRDTAGNGGSVKATTTKKKKKKSAKQRRAEREAREAEELLAQMRAKAGAGAGGGASSDLVAAILGKNRARQASSFADSLAAKYAGMDDEPLNWSDEEEEEEEEAVGAARKRKAKKTGSRGSGAARRTRRRKK